MKRFVSHRGLNVFSFERDMWEFPEHNHNHYELIFIERGSGSHKINDVSVSFQTGDVFLLNPADSHEFVLHEKTFFSFIQFDEKLLIRKLACGSFTNWSSKIKMMLHSPSMGIGNIIYDEKDRHYMFSTLQILKQEFSAISSYDEMLVSELLGVMLRIIFRNIIARMKNNTQSEQPTQHPVTLSNEAEKILSYIRQHVLDKEKLSIKAIAKTFNISPNYVGMYIKKHTGESLQSYLAQYKLNIATRLLLSKNLSISEISYKLSFNDASHFNKFFKKNKGISPSDFRMQTH